MEQSAAVQEKKIFQKKKNAATDRSTDWCAPVSYLQEIVVLRGSLPVIADAEDLPGLQRGPASLKALEFLDNLGARRVTRIKDVEVAVVLNNKRAAPRGAGRHRLRPGHVR